MSTSRRPWIGAGTRKNELWQNAGPEDVIPLVALAGAAEGGEGAGSSPDNPLVVSSGGYSTSVAIGRPENTTAYNAGDAVGVADSGTPANAGSAVLEFANVGPDGGHVLLTSCDLRIDLSAIPSGMTSFRLHLYGTAPTAILDNAAWDLVSGDRAAYRGYVDLGVPVDVGSTLWVQTDAVNRHIKLSDGETSLFGILVTNGGYTPASATVYTPRIRTLAL